MSADSSLGKASLSLEADLDLFRKNVDEAKGSGEGLSRTLDALAAVADIANRELNKVGIDAGRATESRASAEAIVSGVRGISEEAVAAARELDKVRLTETQAAESKLAAEGISEGLDQVSRNARQATRDLVEVKLAGGRNGVGVGPFGSGFGRIGLLGSAIGAGVLTTPVAGPASLGLLAAIPAVAGAGAGALGTLALAFDGVTKAIGGNKKAFDDLGPSAQQFVLTVRSLDGEFDHLRQLAASSVFPGLTAGLKAALDPGTIHEIDTAIEEFGHSIGAAGEEWGRYFGSPEFQQTFGPLMAEGAKDIGLASDAALHLFDAVGQLAQAGIPLTDWLLTTATNAAKLADGWIHEKEATGELSDAMKTAKTDLELVGHLAGALIGVIVALGDALHPVSQVAVKDLTDGLHWLSHVISDNKAEIRDIVGSALTVLVGALKAVIALLIPVVKDADAVAHAIGGWKVAFALVLSGVIAKALYGVALQMAGVSTEAAAAMTWSARLGAVLEGLRKMGPIIIAIGIDYFVNKYGAKNTIHAALNPFDSLGPDVAKDQTITVGGKQYPIGTSAAVNALRTAGFKGQLNSAVDEITAAHSLGGSSSISKADVQKNIAEATKSTGDQIQRAISSIGAPPAATGAGASPFGAVPPWTSGLGGSGSKKPTVTTGANLLSQALRDAIQKAKDEAAQTQGTVAAQWLARERADLEQAQKDLTKQLNASGVSDKQKAAIRAELRNIQGQLTSVNVQIAANLKAQAAAIRQSFSSQISSAKAAISTALSTLTQDLDAQLQQQLQGKIDELGATYYQGNDPLTGAPRQTPLEQQLAQMQQADQKQSLIDTLNAAEQQQQQDALPGSGAAPGYAAADKKAVDAAKRQLSEFDLAIEAARQRQKADADYAAAVQKAQNDYAEKQRQLNEQLSLFGQNLVDGKAKLSDLSGIVSAFGLSITADDGIETDFSTLSDKVVALGGLYDAESAKLEALAKPGGSLDKFAQSLDALAQKLNGQYGGSSASTDALGRWLHNQGVPGFKDGGYIRTGSLPQLILMHGDEEGIFSGSGRSMSDALAGLASGVRGGDGATAEESHIHFHGGTFIGARPQQVARDLKPYLDRVSGVSTS